MGLTLIFKWKGTGLKVRRSDKEKILEKEGWGSSLTEEQMDKLDFAERKIAREGLEHPLFLKAAWMKTNVCLYLCLTGLFGGIETFKYY